MLAKLGPHNQLAPTAAAFQWARQARTAKQMDRTDLLGVAPGGATTVYRRYFGYQDLSRNGGDVAREVIASLGGFRPTYLELYNEIGSALGAGLERHVDFTAEAAPVVHAAGLKLAGFSFSTGTPSEQGWRYLQARGFGGCDAVSLHEYWGNLGFTLDHGLRHRWVHAILGGSHPPLLITECGRDQVEGGGRGWKASGVSPAQYIGELQTYDALLAQDSYVVGATAFTCAPDPSKFGDFELDSLVGAILGLEPPPPMPTPAPVTIPVSLVFGLLLGAGVVTLVAAEARRQEQEGEIVVYDLREIEAGRPIPPGYIIIRG